MVLHSRLPNMSLRNPVTNPSLRSRLIERRLLRWTGIVREDPPDPTSTDPPASS